MTFFLGDDLGVMKLANCPSREIVSAKASLSLSLAAISIGINLHQIIEEKIKIIEQIISPSQLIFTEAVCSIIWRKLMKV